MFTFNKETLTKTGKKVIPFSVDGEIVYCFDLNKKTILLKLTDFDFNKPIEKKEIQVKEMKETFKPEIKEELIITEIVSQSDELFEEEIDDSFIDNSKDTSIKFIPDEEYI